MKRKVTYEQDAALAAGRAKARSNQRAGVAARQAAERERQERDAQQAKLADEQRALRAGFELGDRVTGRDFMWNESRSGTVVDGDLYDGVPVLCDDGQVRVLYRNSLHAA